MSLHVFIQIRVSLQEIDEVACFRFDVLLDESRAGILRTDVQCLVRNALRGMPRQSSPAMHLGKCEHPILASLSSTYLWPPPEEINIDNSP